MALFIPSSSLTTGLKKSRTTSHLLEAQVAQQVERHAVKSGLSPFEKGGEEDL